MEVQSGFTPFEPLTEFSDSEAIRKSEEFYYFLKKRRTIREFSEREIPRELIENCLRSASTAPSGANKQPWLFCAIENPEIKSKIRKAAEKEENLFYSKRASKSWLRDLKKFATSSHKPYLETAPYLIAIFYKTHEGIKNSEKTKTYYAKESTGIATGMLITALHESGLSTLTHTPSPMIFLNHILDIPSSQCKPFLLLVTGYPKKGTLVPEITKKNLSEVSRFY